MLAGGPRQSLHFEDGRVVAVLLEGGVQLAGPPPHFLGGVAAGYTTPPALAVSATSAFLTPRPGTCAIQRRAVPPSLLGLDEVRARQRFQFVLAFSQFASNFSSRLPIPLTYDKFRLSARYRPYSLPEVS